MSGAAWDPEQYEKFREERERPFFDLLALVRRNEGMRVVDLGCGTGKQTRELHHRLLAKETLGIDQSEEMLAGTSDWSDPGLRFERGEIEAFRPDAPFDLVFSNAALHWVEDHETLLARLAALLTARGQLAIQMPVNEENPSHQIANEVAGEEPFCEALGGFVHRSLVLGPEAYAIALERLGFPGCHVRLQIYLHRLDSPDGVVEWVKGTLLTGFEKRLSPELFASFLARYRERIRPAFPAERPTLFTYRRLLLWASRTA